MVQADEKLVGMLRHLQKEIRTLQEAGREQDVEITRLEAALSQEDARLRETKEKLMAARALLESAEEEQRRQLILAKTGRREFFRDDPDDPKYIVEVTRSGEVYKV